MAKPKQFVALMISFVLLTAISCELSALKDQASNPHYRTRVALLIRNSTSDVVAASQAHDDSFQVRAIADIVKSYGWREVIPFYEDTDYGNGLIPNLNDAFQVYNIRVPSFH
ncbi:hypothetical protein Q3G72_012136 [Acer saccharum]|nr:hypothetical protein Q3G72_012136 [Acer saccharum]